MAQQRERGAGLRVLVEGVKLGESGRLPLLLKQGKRRGRLVIMQRDLKYREIEKDPIACP